MAELQKYHVRQHYIPQFILKNFCYDQSKEKVFFFKAGENEYSTEFVSNVFMEKNLYTTAENSVEIEESLAMFEKDVAPIFKKFSQNSEISLTLAEDERLRIFLSLLAFCAANTRNQFNNMSDLSKAMYSKNSGDTNMKDLWLKNVYLISRHRSIKEILSDSEISDLLKGIFLSEFSDFYMCLLERRGDVVFLISDCYPAVWNGALPLEDKTINVPLYYFYPISDSKIIVLVTNYIKAVPKAIVELDCDKTLKEPKLSLDRTHVLYHAAKVYPSEVEWINDMIIKNAKVGIVIKDLNRCSNYL